MKSKKRVFRQRKSIFYYYKLPLLLAVIVVSAILTSCSLPFSGVPPATPQSPNTPEPPPVSPVEPVTYVTIEELWQKMESQADIGVIDARLKEYYDEEHIKGALSIPYSTVVAREYVMPPAKEIIVYCACPDEDTSTKTALELIKHGFTNVKVLKGGYNAWKDKGFPTQTGG